MALRCAGVSEAVALWFRAGHAPHSMAVSGPATILYNARCPRLSMRQLHPLTEFVTGFAGANCIKSGETDRCGMLGHGARGYRLIPIAVQGSHTFTQVSSGYMHTCGVRSGGTALCWGELGYCLVSHGSGTPWSRLGVYSPLTTDNRACSSGLSIHLTKRV